MGLVKADYELPEKNEPQKYETFLIEWPLYFDKQGDLAVEMDVCTVCFGGLIYMDSKPPKEKLESSQDSGEKDQIIEAVMRTLVTFREEDGSWASKYSIENNRIYSGTINQTTLSLSTLLKLNFLNSNDPYFEKRFKFFSEGIIWLLVNRNESSNHNEWSWGYTVNVTATEKEKEFSMMQTLFVYEILLKYDALLTSYFPDIEKKINKY